MNTPWNRVPPPLRSSAPRFPGDPAIRPRTGAALILAAGLLATGCSADDGTDDESGDVAAPPTETTTAATESAGPGGLPSSSGELPDGFPSDEVPLVEGEIGEVLVNDAVGSYLVKVYSDTDFATAFEDASTRLTDAGFEPGRDVISAGPTSSTADFTSDDWFVVVTGGLPDPDRALVQYTIYPE